MAQYLANAFSLQMLNAFPADLKVTEVGRETIPADVVSVIGHQDTANVLGVAMNRQSVSLNVGDTLYVAQLQGGRLPEGSTTLPEGFSFRFLKVELA